MDACKRLSNLSPVARGSINHLDCLKDQDVSACNRNNANRSGYKGA